MSLKIQPSRESVANRVQADRSAMRLLKQRDLRDVLTAIQELHAFDRSDQLAFAVMSILLKLVPARGASFNRLELKSIQLLCQGYPKTTLEPLTERSRQNFIRFQDEHPFVSLYRETGGFGPVRTTDLMSQREFERLAIYNEYYRPVESRFQIEFTLPAPREVCLCLVLDRPDKNFSERDRAVLTLLRPHIAVAHRSARLQMLLAGQQNGNGSGESLTSLGLTPRQAEVLHWITQGKTNPEIGAILGASHHTIHQHVGAILSKLGVENRAAAMLRALEVLGLPAAPNHTAT